MSAIYSWTRGSDTLGIAPWVKDGNSYKLLSDQIVTKIDPPVGSFVNDANRRITLGVVNGLQFEIIKPPTDYWGLIASSSQATTWYIVRIYLYADSPTMPKITDYDTVNNGGACLFTMGDMAYTANGEYLPKFKEYNPVGNDYFEIKNNASLAKFPLGSNNSIPSARPWTGSPGGSNPNKNPAPTIKTKPDYGSADSLERRLGPGSGTTTSVPSTAKGSNVSEFYLPLLDPNIFRPQAPSKSGGGGGGGGGNKNNGGQWVTGPDGAKVFLPGKIDFDFLKKEYDRTHPRPETKIVVRMPTGYAAPKTTNGTKPRMTQIRLDLTEGETGRAIGEVTKTFVFPYIPQNIRYADIGSEWQEIPRPLNVPFVDWARYKLMKVSMDFLVAAQFDPSGTASSSTVSDGLMGSVTPQLNLLRQMASDKFPVYLEGFDDLLQVQIARSRFERPRGMEFVIQDLNITAARRTIDEKTGLATNPSQISAAQVSITLQEIPIEKVTLVKLPPLDLGTPLINKVPGAGGGIPNLGLQSSILTGRAQTKWDAST